MSKLSITALILTYNEELHLDRCLSSINEICDTILIVDSFSNDNTLKIAKNYKAHIIQNEWVNHAYQINWALNNFNFSTDWVFRIDADEYVSSELILNLQRQFCQLSMDVKGICINRLMYFMNSPLKRGGMYPIKHLRLWRVGSAYCEQRWMDERMKLTAGKLIEVEGDLIDHNLNNMTWWTSKHNNYATKEMLDFFDNKYSCFNKDSVKASFWGRPEERRRWVKHQYLNLPLFIRPFLFFLYRYFIQLAILEGKRGFIWTFLQCFWYRFLVDVKINEVYQSVGGNKEEVYSFLNKTYKNFPLKNKN